MSVMGRMGSVDITQAATATLLCGPLDEPAICNVLVTNRTNSMVRVRIAIGTGTQPAAADWIDYDNPLDANQPLERSGLALSQGEKIWVQSSAAGVSARAHGIPAS